MSSKGLISYLFKRTKCAVLKELVLSGDTPVHLRELARRTGLDPSGVRRELDNLIRCGIALSSQTGNQKLCKLNKRCPIYEEIRTMMLKTAALGDEIRAALKPLAAKIEKAFIYGSIASGLDSAESDVDLLVVGNVSLREVTGAATKPGRRIGRVINPIVMKPMEYKQQLSEAGSFINRIESGPLIHLIGDDDEPG